MEADIFLRLCEINHWLILVYEKDIYDSACKALLYQNAEPSAALAIIINK